MRAWQGLDGACDCGLAVDYVTWHIGTPMGTVARQTAEFTPLPNGGTHLSLRSAKVESANALAQALVRGMMPLVAAKKLAQRQRASKAALEKLVAEDGAAAGKQTAA